MQAMKNTKKKRKLFLHSIVLTLFVCLFSLPVTAMAYAADEESPVETPKTAVGTEQATESETETPYSYTVSEDGRITITIDNVEWDYDLKDTAESKITGKVVNVNSYLNLRTGPSTSYSVIGHLLGGTEVEVLGESGGWYEIVLPEQTGYVHSDYLQLLESSGENNELDSATFTLMLQLFQSMSADGKSRSALTPEGNLTLIDEFLQTEVPASEDTELQEKQFITVQSKNGNYFYLIIDRAGDSENVYFLNMVDEADLLALMEDGDMAAACTCANKCEAGAVNTACEVCKNNMTECMGKEAVQEQQPDEAAEPEPDTDTSASGGSGVVIVFVLLLLGGGGALYWFKFRKNKPDAKGPVDLDDYDYGEEDENNDEEYETEQDDADEAEPEE